MVLADRAVENVRNGRRSRGPSPNGHSTVVIAGGVTESSSDDENSRKNGNSSKATKAKSEYEEKIRVGRDYQAVCPDMVPAPERKPEQMNDRALLVWSPTKEIPDSKLEEYITVAKEKYGYNGEQALGMLFWHKHDLERAVLDLANFTPFPDEWTVEDKVLFEQAFQFHGKSFHRIRQMLPDKSIASLVKFYYSWKKTRSRTSVMDRQEKMKKNDSSENGSDHGSNEDSDDDKPATATVGGSNSVASSTTQTATSGGPSATTLATATTNGTGAGDSLGEGKSSSTVVANDAEMADSGEPMLAEGAATGAVVTNGGTTNGGIPTTTTSLNCSGCGVTCSELNATPQGNLCGSCYHHWRRTGVLRPTSGPTFMNKRARNSNLLGKSGDSHKRRPPRGMYINHDDIVKLADSAQNNTGGTGGSADTAPGTGTGGVDLLAGMDREIVSLWSQIQLNKQQVSKLKADIERTGTVVRPAEVVVVRFTSRWNNEELLLAVQGVRKFGRNFQAIADTIGTKTEAQLRTFYVNYRRKYNLDSVLKDYEEEQKLLLQEQEQQLQQQQQQQLNSNNSNSNNNKEDDSTTSVSELESAADTNSIAGDSKLLELGKKSVDQDIMEIDLDDDMVNGKKAAETGDVGGGSASTSSLPTGSVTGSSSAAGGGQSTSSVQPAATAATAEATATETAMDVDDPVPVSDSGAAKHSDSGSGTIVIK